MLSPRASTGKATTAASRRPVRTASAKGSSIWAPACDSPGSESKPNPAHRRAKLLTPTEQGRDAIARISPGHAAAAGQLAKTLGEQPLADAVAALRSLSAALEEAWLA